MTNSNPIKFKLVIIIVFSAIALSTYIAVLYGCSSSGPGLAPPIVQTKYGTVQGVREYGSYIFRGIRYAAAPVGDLRWKPPVDPPSWEGTYDASRWGDVCPQIDKDPAIPSTYYRASEDCLNLNVWTPALDSAKRPVMVYIHGGSWYVSSSQDPIYEGPAFAERYDVVMVSLNYRMSVFGFLFLAGLDDPEAANYPESGCLGILDQIKALEWVRDNIANFGGDPNNVTIFGESAGAMSICLLMSMPRAKGLFHKAIAQSGGLNTLRNVSVAAQQAKKVVKDHIEATSIAQLKTKTTEELRQGLVKYLSMDLLSSTRFGPVMDGTIIPANPLQEIANGSASDIPFLCGTNADEARYWGTFVALLLLSDITTVRNNLPYINNALNAGVQIEQGYISRHSEWDPNEVEGAGSICMKICSDALFRIPTIRIAEAQTPHQEKTYLYLFTWPSPVNTGIYGSCHTLELGFVFNTLYTNSSKALTGENPPNELAKTMIDLWTSFARTGVPSATGVPIWPKYDTASRKTMRLDYRAGNYPAILNDPFSGDRQAWDGIPFDSATPSL